VPFGGQAAARPFPSAARRGLGRRHCGTEGDPSILWNQRSYNPAPSKDPGVRHECCAVARGRSPAACPYGARGPGVFVHVRAARGCPPAAVPRPTSGCAGQPPGQPYGHGVAHHHPGQGPGPKSHARPVVGFLVVGRKEFSRVVIPGQPQVRNPLLCSRPQLRVVYEQGMCFPRLFSVLTGCISAS